MAALGGFPGQMTGRGQLATRVDATRARSVWVEAVEARRKWHDLATATGQQVDGDMGAVRPGLA